MSDKDAAESVLGIEVPPLNLNTFRVRIEQVPGSPLVMHRFDPDDIAKIEAKQTGKALTGKAPRSPEAEFEAARYLDAEGRDCVRAIWFKAGLIAACRQLGDSKLTMTFMRGACHVLGDLIPLQLQNGGPTMRRDMVKVGRAKIPRYRPEYQGWSCEIDIVHNPNVISAEQIVNLLNVAGFCSGLAENRPEKRGDCWGMYRVADTTGAD